MVSIQHPKSILKRLSPIIWGISALLLIFLSIQGKTFNLTTILPLYVIGTHILFKRHRADFYIDTQGMVQPEIFKKNYNWSEISNFKIYEDAISFSIQGKPVEITIPDGKAKEIHEFMIKSGLEKMVTIP